MALNKFLIAVKKETTYGVDAFAGAPTEWLAVEDVTFQNVEGMVENTDATASDSGRPHVAFGLKSTIQITMNLMGKSGVAGTGPFESPLHEACGFGLTLNAAVDARLAPKTAEKSSVTIYLGLLDDTDDSVVYAQKFLGCRGQWSASGTAGESVTQTFSMEGLYHEFPASSAAPSLPQAYSGEKKELVFINATHEVDGVGYCIEAFELALNREIKEDRCGTSSNLVDEIYLDKGSRAGGSLQFKGRSATLAAILPLAKSGATQTHELTFSDGTDTVSIVAPAVQIGTVSWTKDGRWKFDAPFYYNGTWGSGETGDNEFEIIYT